MAGSAADVNNAMRAFVQTVTGLASDAVLPAYSGRVREQKAAYAIVTVVTDVPAAKPQTYRAVLDDTYSEQIGETRQMRVQVDVFGRGADSAPTVRGYMETLGRRWWGSSAAAEALRAAGVSVQATSAVRDLTSMGDAAIAPRFSMDFTVLTARADDAAYEVDEAAEVVVDVDLQRDGTTVLSADVTKVV